MGFYPPSAQDKDDAAIDAADPPFMVRDKERIVSQLGGNFSLPHGFTAIPLVNNNQKKVNVFHQNCPYIQARFHELLKNAASFTE